MLKLKLQELISIIYLLVICLITPLLVVMTLMFFLMNMKKCLVEHIIICNTQTIVALTIKKVKIIHNIWLIVQIELLLADIKTRLLEESMTGKIHLMELVFIF